MNQSNMKKYLVKDADGIEYNVEEIENLKKDEEEVTEEITETAEELSADEIKMIRELIKPDTFSKLLVMVAEKVDEGEEDPMATDSCEPKDEKEEVDEEEDDDEEIIDTDEEELVTKKRACDSIGSIEKNKNKKIDDSYEESVDDAWQKRYNK